MNINLNKLNHLFTQKPILVGGKAMEYYGIRKSGKDIDLIVAEEDLIQLIKKYPHRVKNLGGDLGVCPFEFEIWKTICYFDYDFYKKNAIDIGSVFVVSLEKLLFMKALAYKKEKFMKDVCLIADNVLKKQELKYKQIKFQNEKLLKEINNIVYIEKTGPSK